RRRADAVGALTEVDRVEVVLQDPLLGLLPGDLHRDEDLFYLPARGLRAADALVVIAHELLGNGRAALKVAAAEGVFPRGAPEAGRRDPALVEEVAVFGGQHRVDDLGWDLLVADHLPVRRPKPAEDGVPVAGVNHRLGRHAYGHLLGGHRGLAVDVG